MVIVIAEALRMVMHVLGQVGLNANDRINVQMRKVSAHITSSAHSLFIFRIIEHRFRVNRKKGPVRVPI